MLDTSQRVSHSTTTHFRFLSPVQSAPPKFHVWPIGWWRRGRLAPASRRRGRDVALACRRLARGGWGRCVGRNDWSVLRRLANLATVRTAEVARRTDHPDAELDAGSSFPSTSACCNTCQHNSPHLRRIGERETPIRASNSSFENCFVSSRVLPSISSASIEAAAWLMAQPWPSKQTWQISPSEPNFNSK